MSDQTKPCAACGHDDPHAWVGKRGEETVLECGQCDCCSNDRTIAEQAAEIEARDKTVAELRSTIERLKAERDAAVSKLLDRNVLLGLHEQKAGDLRAELAQATEANESVAVCRDHTADVTVVDGLHNDCLVCELARLRPLADGHAGKTFAPWTEGQVAQLNANQRNPMRHPFTCGNDPCRSDLVATHSGWTCPNCGEWKQTWAHNFMLGIDALRPLAEIGGLLTALVLERGRLLIQGPVEGDPYYLVICLAKYPRVEETTLLDALRAAKKGMEE